MRALHFYVESTVAFYTSVQLFVAYGGPPKGDGLSKQRLSHWLVDIICSYFCVSGRPLPLEVCCHSTKYVALSWATLKGVP